MPRYYDDAQQTQTVRYDADGRADNQPVYIGFAEKGTSESTKSWTIHKFAYDGSSYPTSRTIAIDSWENRTTASYE